MFERFLHWSIRESRDMEDELLLSMWNGYAQDCLRVFIDLLNFRWIDWVVLKNLASLVMPASWVDVWISQLVGHSPHSRSFELSTTSRDASVSLYGIVEVVLLDVKDARITVVAYARERNWNSLFQYKCDAVAPEGTASQGSSSSVQVVSSALINIS